MKFQQIDEDSDLLVPFSGFYWRSLHLSLSLWRFRTISLDLLLSLAIQERSHQIYEVSTNR
ncbi:hypothetical protein HanRHA438_Chr06g0268551 [Helianthus annuus]|uniref:Uncharacterized protein n=1 Tax=Helianthus annuus TaxID=4232 RepID=A0A251TNM2_HELAN|nr:hypothetical protein HanIR_Chr06g0279171 [Helianthus annuus]KAJ0911923.1 hypothetical protein HanRHA438_Chr06g0268551 [Helianthus annuus]